MEYCELFNVCSTEIRSVVISICEYYMYMCVLGD